MPPEYQLILSNMVCKAHWQLAGAVLLVVAFIVSSSVLSDVIRRCDGSANQPLVAPKISTPSGASKAEAPFSGIASSII